MPDFAQTVFVERHPYRPRKRARRSLKGPAVAAVLFALAGVWPGFAIPAIVVAFLSAKE